MVSTAAWFGFDGAGRVGPALLPGQAGGAGAEEWPLATFHNETALVGVGARVGSHAGPGGCQVSAVGTDEEASSNKIGL